LLGILALGALLRIVGLNTDLWVDEVVSLVTYMRLSLWDALGAYESPNQHLLNSLLGGLSIRLFGESHWAARLPAVLFGLAGLWALYFLARAITSRREALLATALMCVSYHHVWFSQNARGYAGMMFFCTLGTGIYLRGLHSHSNRTWLLYAACMALGTTCVQNTVFVVFGHVAAYPLVFSRWPNWRRNHRPLTTALVVGVVGSGLLSLMAHGRILGKILTFLREEDRVGFGGGLASPLDFFRVLFQGLQSGFIGPAFLVGAILLGIGWISYARQSRLLAGVIALPVLFNGLAVVLLRYGAYPRSLLYCLPLVLLVAVRGGTVLGAWLAARTRPSTGRLKVLGSPPFMSDLVVGLMLVLSAVSLAPNYTSPKQDYTGALSFVRTTMGPNDRVCSVGLAGKMYSDYYAPDLPCPETPAELRELIPANGHLWVIYSFRRGDMALRYADLLSVLRDEFEEVEAFPGTLGDGWIDVVRAPMIGP
jgi:4-amino-4-deoxy-L-arabinose transferase-like glycosyltransferase